MDKDQQIKIVPPIARNKKGKAKPKQQDTYGKSMVALAILWLAIFCLAALIPMAWYMRILALTLGSFLVFDIHHSIKHYVRSKQASSN